MKTISTTINLCLVGTDTVSSYNRGSDLTGALYLIQTIDSALGALSFSRHVSLDHCLFLLLK